MRKAKYLNYLLYVSCARVSRLVMSDSVTPWTVADQAALSMEFPRQDHWSGLPFPTPGDPLNPGIESGSSALQGDSLMSEPPGKVIQKMLDCKKCMSE